MATLKLSGLIQGVSGKMGGVVFQDTPVGTTMRDLVIPANPKTAPQETLRSDFGTATKLYRTLTSTQLKTWVYYASLLPDVRRKSGKMGRKNAFNTFTGLSTKFLQITPGGTVPLTAPTVIFAGDTVAVTAATGTGSITFTASKANGESVKTELLLQRVADANRKPTADGYRSQQFAAFATGSLTARLEVAAGTYSPAYRFVNFRTGEEAGFKVLPTVTVP